MLMGSPGWVSVATIVYSPRVYFRCYSRIWLYSPSQKRCIGNTSCADISPWVKQRLTKFVLCFCVVATRFRHASVLYFSIHENLFSYRAHLKSFSSIVFPGQSVFDGTFHKREGVFLDGHQVADEWINAQGWHLLASPSLSSVHRHSRRIRCFSCKKKSFYHASCMQLAGVWPLTLKLPAVVDFCFEMEGSWLLGRTSTIGRHTWIFQLPSRHINYFHNFVAQISWYNIQILFSGLVSFPQSFH